MGNDAFIRDDHDVQLFVEPFEIHKKIDEKHVNEPDQNVGPKHIAVGGFPKYVSEENAKNDGHQSDDEENGEDFDVDDPVFANEQLNFFTFLLTWKSEFIYGFHLEDKALSKHFALRLQE